ncbi:MAG: ankyrin repeat domain-containing protein [Planctomycetaceae bacterium]
MAEFLVKTTQTGKSQGPFSGSQLKKLAGSGQLRPTCLISLDGGESWHEAKKISGLKFGIMEADAGTDERSGPNSTTSAIPVVDQPPLVFAESHWKKCFAFNPTGDRLAIGGEGTVTLWDIPAKSLDRVIRGKRDADVESLAFSESGQQIVVCFEDDYKARVFDVATGERTHLLDGENNGFAVFGLVAPDASLVATNGWRGTVDRWDLESGEKLSSIIAYAGSTTEVQSLAATSDGAFVLTCRDDDEDLRIFSFETSQRIGVCWGHESVVKAVAASPLPNVVASGDENGTIVLWDIPTGKTTRKLNTELNSVADLVFSPCGTKLLVTGHSNCILVLNVDDLSTLRRLELGEDPSHLVLSADGSLLACDGTSEGVVVWHLGSSHDSLDEMVQVSGGAMADGEFDADDDSNEEESDSSDDEDSDDEEQWDEDDDAIDGEEEVEGVFDPDDWSLATEGEIEWSVLLEAVGTPREASLLTREAWQSAQAENRVLTILHSGDGMQYVGRVGLHRGRNYCRAVVNLSMPGGIRVSDVDISSIDCNFYAAATEAEDASESLMQACRDGDIDAARQAISDGADVTHNDYETQSTPLKAAIVGGNIEIVRMLIEAGVGPDSEWNGWQIAIAVGQSEIAALLSESGFEQEPGQALLAACRLGQSSAVSDMLEMIDDINESVTVYDDQPLEGTPLTVAAAAGQLEIVSQLIKVGANPSSTDSRNITPWAAAASGGHQQVCELLESRGVEKDVQTALVVAAERGQVKVAESLIEGGADVNGMEKLGGDRVTALETIVVSDRIEKDPDSSSGDDGDQEAVEERRAELFEMLLKRGGNPDITNDDGQPLLHQIVIHSRADCLRMLAESGAKLEATDSNGITALTAAASQNDTGMVGGLLFRGANPNVSNAEGVPALLLMFDEYNQCNAEIAKWLIAYGVDLSITDPKGRVLEQLCERTIEKNSGDGDEDVDEDSREQADEILAVLRDQEIIGRFHGLLARASATDEDFWERLECAIAFLDNNGLAYSLVRDQVMQRSNDVDGMLRRLFAHDDWRHRYAAADSLIVAKLATEEVLPLMLDNLSDPDEDVQGAIHRAIVALGQKAVDPLITALADCPTELLQTLWSLINIIDPARGPDVRLALKKMSPDDPEATRGLDRLRSGIVLGMLGTFLEQGDETAAALALYEQSVRLNPNLQIGFWSELATLRSSQGDDALQQALELYNYSREADSFDEAWQLLENAMETAPEFPWSCNNLAWTLATSEEQSIRDGDRAVELATRICEQDQWHHHSFMDTLAATYAEVGNFEKAVELVEKAIDAAPLGFQGEYQENLNRYQSGQAWPTSEESESGETF